MNKIQMAAKMYDARDTARVLLGDKFKERMAQGISILKALAEEHHITIEQAAIRSAKMYTDQYNGMAAMMVLAALVESVEPSDTTISKQGAEG
jgi:hypothetical protein